MPADIKHYPFDTPLRTSGLQSFLPFSTAHRPSYPHHRPSIHTNSNSPFGTLNVPSSHTRTAPRPRRLSRSTLPRSPCSTRRRHTVEHDVRPLFPTLGSGDFLHPPSSTILARRTSVIAVDGNYYKPAHVSRRRESSFISHDLDEEQETGDLNGMEEIKVPGQEVVHQGDVREHFYVVENGLTHFTQARLARSCSHILHRTELLISNAGMDRVVMNSHNTVFDMKHFIGRKFNDPDVEADIKQDQRQGAEQVYQP